MKLPYCEIWRSLIVLFGFAACCAHAADAMDCRRFYDQLDAVIDRADVRDAQENAVKAYPYLRSNRFIASQISEKLSAAQLEFLLQQMRALDANGRRIELGNLPETSRNSLDNIRNRLLPDQTSNESALAECGRLLLGADDLSLKKIINHVSSPARYSLFSRLIGFYPLTAIPFSRGIRKFQAEMTQTFAKPLNEVVNNEQLIVHAPPQTQPLDVAAVLRDANANPLNIPLPDEAKLAELFRHFAPNFAIDTRGEFDRPGAVQWSDSGQIKIDPSTLRVYTLASHTSMAGQTLLQLNYLIWFSERPKKGAFDMLGGALDGLIWRVTLAPDGTALMHDSIHPCGCYHLFFPGEKLRAKPPHPSLQEHAYVPQALPDLKPGERLTVWIESATHYVVRVGAETTRVGNEYAFANYDELRSLEKPDGTRRSLFRPDGLVGGSERGERILFWPMGIASAGAMRQWGHHATAFVGKRHFDDPDLIEKAFDWLQN